MSGLSLSISLAGGGDMAVGWRLSPSSYVSMCQKLQQRSLSRSFPIPSFSFFSAGPRRNLQITASVPQVSLTSTSLSTLSLSGLEDVMTEYISGKRKATEVAHSVWRHIVQKGDTLVDATCGNGYDTLAMVKMIANKSHTGHVYAMDIQQEALKNTSSLLKESLDPDEAKHVELFAICHSKMEEIVPKSATVRLVAFNLGYLPGGDKAIITVSNTTLQALEAAKRILAPAGLISTVVYIGHPGGREEFETVEAFASGLPVEDWICCKLQMSNRPLAPILVLIWKK